jgi:very-short-patch-repair endonuclease
MGRKPFVPEALTRGPFTIVEARQAGLQRWHLEGASWMRVAQGTYVRAGTSDVTLATLVAVSKRFPASAAFSGMTAAWLHRVDVSPCDPIEVTVPRHLGVSRPRGIRVRRALLSDAEVVRLRGFRATSILRTIADISAAVSLTEAVVVADAALHSRLVTLDELNTWASTQAGRPGIGRVRSVISLADPKAESQMESRLRMLLFLGGLPRPKSQVSIYDSAGRFVGRPDLYYEASRLGVEYDGGTHRNSLVEDNHRQNNLLGAGVRLLRFTAADVLQDPAAVVQHVKAMLTN